MSSPEPKKSVTASCSESVKLIESQKRISSGSLHDISWKLFYTKAIPSLFFCLFLSGSLSRELPPSDWKLGKLIQLLKNGDRTSASNYVRILLTCIASNLLGYIVYTCILKHPEKNKMNNHDCRCRRRSRGTWCGHGWTRYDFQNALISWCVVWVPWVFWSAQPLQVIWTFLQRRGEKIALAC